MKVRRVIALCLALLILGPMALADYSGGAGMGELEVTIRVMHHYTGEMLIESVIGRSRWGGSLYAHLQDVGYICGPDDLLIAEWYRNDTRYGSSTAVAITSDLGYLPLNGGDVLVFSVFPADGFLNITQSFVNSRGAPIADTLCGGFDYLFDPAGMGYTKQISIDLDGLAELGIEPEGYIWQYSKYKMRTMADYETVYDRAIYINPVTSDIEVIYVYVLDGEEDIENPEPSISITATDTDDGVYVGDTFTAEITYQTPVEFIDGVIDITLKIPACELVDVTEGPDWRGDTTIIESGDVIELHLSNVPADHAGTAALTLELTDYISDGITVAAEATFMAIGHMWAVVSDSVEIDCIEPVGYTVIVEYVDESGQTLEVAETEITHQGPFTAVAKEIDSYVCAGYRIDGDDFQMGQMVTIDLLTANVTISFVYTPEEKELPELPELPNGGGSGGTSEGGPDKELPDESDGYPELVTDSIPYLQGYPDGTVRPEREMTRGEIAMIVYRLIVADDKDNAYTTDMSDICNDDWFHGAIAYLTHYGIMDAYTDGTFRPDDTITRAELMQVISHFSDMHPGTIIFDDVAADHWAADYIANAASREWVLGYPDGTFRPDAAISRAEAVTVINRLLGWGTSNADHQRVYTDIGADHWAYDAIMVASGW